MEPRRLDASMDNVYAWRLGMIAKEAGDPNRKDVGDPIDRGLVLLQMLNAKGFTIMVDYPAP